jgi:high-affinity nickel-transport protein
VSVIVAVYIGGIETLGLIVGAFELEGRFLEMIGSLNDNWRAWLWHLCVFALIRLVSVLIYQSRGPTLTHAGPRPASCAPATAL